MSLTIDGQANSIASSVGGVNIPATVDTLSVGPSGSYMNVTSSGVAATTITATNITSTNITTTQSVNATTLKSTTIQHTNGTSALNIDSSGRVTKPYQPAFWITDFIWSASTQRAHNAGNVWSNVGSHFNNSNGIFTAPVSGYYLFICTVQGHNPGETAGRNATYYTLNANKNGSNLGNEIVATIQESNGSKHDTITHQAIINLAVNDTFYFNSSYGFRVTQNSYVGYLLG
jgi:hypothetical protein